MNRNTYNFLAGWKNICKLKNFRFSIVYRAQDLGMKFREKEFKPSEYRSSFQQIFRAMSLISSSIATRETHSHRNWLQRCIFFFQRACSYVNGATLELPTNFGAMTQWPIARALVLRHIEVWEQDWLRTLELVQWNSCCWDFVHHTYAHGVNGCIVPRIRIRWRGIYWTHLKVLRKEVSVYALWKSISMIMCVPESRI